MPRRIAIELDGVLAPDVGRDPRPWESLNENEPGVIGRLAETASSQHWEIIFLTQHQRETSATEQMDAQQWLESNGFALPCVYITSGLRGEIASALHLDLVIASRPESCENVVTESNAQTILIWSGERGGLPANARRPEISIARSFSECLDILNKVDDFGPKGVGLFAWVRRLFGWAA